MILPEELESVKFFHSLGPPHVNQLSQLARLQECITGDVLFREGQDWPFICVVLSGHIDLGVAEPGGDAVRVYTAGPGDLVGWSPVLGRRSMTATAQAASRCRLAHFEVSQIQRLCQDDPQFGVAFLRQIALVLSDRLWSTRRHLARTLSHRQPLAAAPEGSD
jgi:CRP-like cAMP-binding protein